MNTWLIRRGIGGPNGCSFSLCLVLGGSKLGAGAGHGGSPELPMESTDPAICTRPPRYCTTYCRWDYGTLALAGEELRRQAGSGSLLHHCSVSLHYILTLGTSRYSVLVGMTPPPVTPMRAPRSQSSFPPVPWSCNCQKTVLGTKEPISHLACSWAPD